MLWACCLTLLLLGASARQGHAAKPPSREGQWLVYVGTYTGPKSKGIYSFHLDEDTGATTAPELAAETTSPSFLAVHPNQRFLYAANEVANFNGTKGGAISAFSIQSDTGQLTLLNQQSSGGSGPCHLVADRSGRFVLAANYGGGSVSMHPIQKDGRLGEASTFIQHQGSSVNPQRQDGPHAHFINTDIYNRFALACDLGLDKVLVYIFNPAKGSLVPNDPPSAAVKPGAGPRHLAFHPRGRYVYVNNEIDSTLTAFAYDPTRGSLKELQSITTLPEPVKGNSTAEVEMHPSGKFVYCSNRGHNSIAVFAIDQASGKLTLVEHQPTQGKTPRNFAIHPKGKYLLAANQDSDDIVVFRIDPKSGRLSSIGRTVEVPSPVCLKFVPLK